MKLTKLMMPWALTLAVTLVTGTALAADAGALWDKHCAKCHGKDGKGNTKMGKQSGAKDYSDPKVQEAMKDDVALKTVKEGITEKGKEKMKAYGAELSDDDIKGLIAHMRKFKK